MKDLRVFRKLGIQLIGAVAISFIVAMAVLLIFSQSLTTYYINNPGNITQLFFNLAFLLMSTACIATFIITFLLLIKRKLRYIKYISDEVNKIAKEQLGSTLKVRGNDELAELCKNINYMSLELKNRFEQERVIENAKTELITNVSHDLRTPLTAIIGYLDILKNESYKSREEEKEYLTSTYNLSMKLKKLIDELFEYTKLSNSEIAMELEEVNLSPILAQILGEYTPILEANGLKLISQIDEEIPVKIEIEKIVRVFDNILSNAEKYSLKPSQVIVKAKNRSEGIHISISNKSKHIEQHKLNQMFEKFYRFEKSRSSNVEGSGLGLAISKKIIELHNGRIWADCKDDRITIQIRFPRL